MDESLRMAQVNSFMDVLSSAERDRMSLDVPAKTGIPSLLSLVIIVSSGIFSCFAIEVPRSPRTIPLPHDRSVHNCLPVARRGKESPLIPSPKGGVECARQPQASGSSIPL